MTKKEYMKLYYSIFGSTHLRGKFWTKHKDTLMYIDDFGGCAQYYITTEGQIYMKKHEEKNMAKIQTEQGVIMNGTIQDIFYNSSLGNCEAATPPLPDKEPHKAYDPMGNIVEYVWKTPQEKGNNPMRIENTTATAYITAEKSLDAVSRDYLLSRLSNYDSWHSPKLRELNELFKLNEEGLPKTYQQLIDAIKGDKFTLDAKKIKRLEARAEDDDMDLEDYGYGPFYAVIFTDLPKADRKGYELAITEFNKLIRATKDIIMTSTPADGLKALQALEAWLPTGKAN